MCKSEKCVNEQFKNKFKKLHNSDNEKFRLKISPKERNNSIFNMEEYEKKL